jgi:5'-methylthioadenosine phosphorylase
VPQLRRAAPQGVPPGRDPVPGVGLLQDRQPVQVVQGRRWVVGVFGIEEDLDHVRGRWFRVVEVVRWVVVGVVRLRVVAIEFVRVGVGWVGIGWLRVGWVEAARPVIEGVVLSTATVGVFGGSGFYSFVDAVDEVTVDTPYGETSSSITIGDVGGVRVAFLPRHGRKHQFPPHKVPYRANVWAMKELGVERLFAPNAVGSLQLEIAPGSFVICDQLVDRTRGRADTFYDGPETTHISFADPYCPTMRSSLVSTGGELGIPLHEKGTVVVIQGPRFSTRAESAWFQRQGWEVINMTQYPEAPLARELEMCFANISLVTDYDVGVGDTPPVTHEEVIRVFDENNARLRDLLFATIPTLPASRDCPCATALAGARFEP